MIGVEHLNALGTPLEALFDFRAQAHFAGHHAENGLAQSIPLAVVERVALVGRDGEGVQHHGITQRVRLGSVDIKTAHTNRAGDAGKHACVIEDVDKDLGPAFVIVLAKRHAYFGIPGFGFRH